MPRAWGVGMRQFVDKDQGGLPRERRIEVEFLDRGTLDVEHQGRQLLEPLEECRGFETTVRLDESYDHINSRTAQGLRCEQHGVGLANPGRRTEKNLQSTALRACLLRLEFGEKLIGVRALLFHVPVSGVPADVAA